VPQDVRPSDAAARPTEWQACAPCRPLRHGLDDLPRERLGIVLTEHAGAAQVAVLGERRRQSSRERHVPKAPTLGRCHVPFQSD